MQYRTNLQKVRDLHIFGWCSIALTCKRSAEAISSAGFLMLQGVTRGPSKTFGVLWQANGFVLAPRWFDMQFCNSNYPHCSGSVFVRKIASAKAIKRPSRWSRLAKHLPKYVPTPKSKSNHASIYSEHLPEKAPQAWHHARPGMSMYVSGAYLQDRDGNCLRLCSHEYHASGGDTEDCRVLGWSRNI